MNVFSHYLYRRNLFLLRQLQTDSVSAVAIAAYTCSSVNPSANNAFAKTLEISCLLTFQVGITGIFAAA